MKNILITKFHLTYCQNVVSEHGLGAAMIAEGSKVLPLAASCPISQLGSNPGKCMG